MHDDPEPLVRLDRYFEVARVAHEAIWDFHRRLTARDLATDRTRELLAEAAQVANIDLPRVAGDIQRMTLRWIDEQVLDPEAASETLRSIQAELERIEPAITRLRRRQDEIAAELRRVLEGDGGA